MPTTTTRTGLRTNADPSPREQRKAERDKTKTSNVVVEKKKGRNLGFDNTPRPPIATANSITITKSNTDDHLNNDDIPIGHQNRNSSVSRSKLHRTGARKNNALENRTTSDSQDSSESKSSSLESEDDHRMDDNYRNNTNKPDASDEDLSDDELAEDDYACVGKKKPKSQKQIFNDFPSMIIGTGKQITREHDRQRQDKRVSLGSSTLSSRFSQVSHYKSVSESQTVADTRKIEERMLSKKDTLYRNLSENEIVRIGWYVRDNLFQRVKIIAETMMKDIIIDVCRVEKIEEINWIDKYNNIGHCVKLNLNYRRAYVTKKIRNHLRGKADISAFCYWTSV